MRNIFAKVPDLRNFAILLIATLLMVVLYGQINYTVEPFSKWDLSVYIKMAAASPAISSVIHQPYAYRVLGPFLAGLLPLPNPTGFYIFAVIFSICLVFQLYDLLRYIRISPAVALVTALLFLFNKYLFGSTIWDYFQINDLLALNFMVILFLAMWKNQWIVFGIVLALGAMTREVSMLAVPIVFVYLLEQKEWSTQWRKVIVASLPGLMIFLLLRIFIPNSGGLSFLDAFLTYSNKLYSPESLFRLLVNSFLPLSFVPLIFFKQTVQFFKARKYALLYVGLVFLSTMFGSDHERLMAPAFIVFYMLIGVILQSLNPEKIFLLFLIAAGFIASFHHQIARYPLPNAYWTYFFSIGSALVVTVGIYFLKRRRQQS